MFDILISLTTPKELNSSIEMITTRPKGDGQVTCNSFQYDQEKETVTVEYEGIDGTGQYKVWQEHYTVDKKLHKMLKADVNMSLNQFKKGVVQKTGDRALLIYVTEVTDKLNTAIQNFNSHKEVRERVVIKNELIRAIDTIKTILGDDYELKLEKLKKSIGNVGNPNFIKNQKEIDIHEAVKKANSYLKNEPESYKPVRKNSFMSSNLRDQLAEDYGVGPSTLRDHFYKKTKKDGQLFIVKNGY